MLLTKCILNTYPFPGGSFLKGDGCCSSGIRIPGHIVPYMWPSPVQCHVCKANVLGLGLGVHGEHWWALRCLLTLESPADLSESEDGDSGMSCWGMVMQGKAKQ